MGNGEMISSSEKTIVNVGANAWRSEKAGKVGFLVDGAEYFAALEQSLLTARRSIMIVGWDFNPDIYLRPDRPEKTLGAFLHDLAENNENLEIRILVWAMGPIYSGKSLSLFNEKTWSAHPRIRLEFDSRHPVRGSHHQKFVVIDDCLAFLGGIDLTAKRWDDSRHLASNPLRVTPAGESYEPVHDVQAAVSGPAARMIGDLGRRRWHLATGEDLLPLDPLEEIWPVGLDGCFSGCDVALARTEPGIRGRRSRKEAFRLTADAIAAAKDSIYIETQYLASFAISEILERQLADPDGPEVIVIVTKISHGFLERVMMGANRDRVIRRLRMADRFGRLRVLYPVVPDADGQECEVLVHAKLVIVDDKFLRLGSSNLNNRSEGLDTESDIAIEAATEECRQAVLALRHRLLAEHLDSSPDLVRERVELHGSLRDAIGALNVNARRLREIELEGVKGETSPVIGTSLVDPKKPFYPLQKIRVGVDTMASRVMSLFV